MNRGLNKAQLSTIAQEILAFLAEHPQAQDTLEGIIQWWLLEQRIKRFTATVQGALSELVDQGLLLERRGPDERTHYRINPRKTAAIRKLLDQ